jgi:hypothetical protein
MRSREAWLFKWDFSYCFGTAWYEVQGLTWPYLHRWPKRVLEAFFWAQNLDWMETLVRGGVNIFPRSSESVFSVAASETSWSVIADAYERVPILSFFSRIFFRASVLDPKFLNCSCERQDMAHYFGGCVYSGIVRRMGRVETGFLTTTTLTAINTDKVRRTLILNVFKFLVSVTPQGFGRHESTGNLSYLTSIVAGEEGTSNVQVLYEEESFYRPSLQ